MSLERQSCPWVWRLTQQVGITRPLAGQRETIIFSNPGEVEAIRFHGQWYKKTKEGTLVLFSDEDLLKVRRYYQDKSDKMVE